MAFVGAPPRRTPDDELTGRRPVVAILDTGCGQHPWLDRVVQNDVTLDGAPIGYTDTDPRPRDWGDLAARSTATIDPLAGHGTFIAGLVHQACPTPTSWPGGS